MAYIGQAPANKPVSSSDLEDGLITNSKLAQDIISGETELATAPADTDEFLISDAGVLKRIDASLIGGGGKVLQAVTGTLSSNSSTTSNSYIATGLDVDITPSATSSKILVMYYMNNYAITSNTRTNMTLYRDSTDLGTGANGTVTGYTSGHHGYQLGGHILDTPNTTSQIHYEVYIKTNSGTLWYGGHDGAGILSVITCLEIGA
tara:strand:+ start:14 stop:628 length:615 start_codon:yes stop_codon:yes gene_type:complete